jgi:hypothetical protein
MRSRITLLLILVLATAAAIFYLTAPSPTDLHVTVVDADTGLPIPEAQVQVQQRGETSRPSRTTNEEGQARFLDLVPDPRYRVRAQKADFALGQIYNLEVPEGETTAVTLTLRFLPDHRLYVGLDSGHVAEFDTASLQVPHVWLLPDESGTVRHLAYSPPLDRIYAGTIQNVHMLGAILGEQRGMLDIQGAVKSLQLTDDGRQVRIMSAVHGSAQLATLDAQTGERLSEVSMRHNSSDAQVLFKPGSQAAYVLDSADQNLWLLDLDTQTVLGKTPLGFQPDLGALSSDGATLYVAARLGDSLAVVSTIVDSVVHRVPLSPGTSALTVSDDGATLFVLNRTLGTLTLFDTANWEFPTVIATGREPVALAISSGPVPTEEEGAKLWAYVANAGDQTISVIYLPTQMVFETVPVPGQPASLVARSRP